MEHLGTPGFDLVVEFVDVVGLDGNFGPVFCSELRTCDDVGFCAIAFDNGQIGIAVAHLEPETGHEEVKTLFQVVVEDFGDQPQKHRALFDHIGLGGVGFRLLQRVLCSSGG